MNYSNTNEKLYDDIALWKKTDGMDLFAQMPLPPEVKDAPTVLDFGYGFGENLFALSNAYPNGKIYGIDCSPVCQKEVGEKVAARGIKNIILINKEVHNLQDFANDSLDLVLLYDALHGGDGKIKAELAEYGFEYAGTCPQKGVHWEKCHTLYYIKKGTITFDALEKVEVMNFRKL